MNKLITFLSPYRGSGAVNMEYSSDRGTVTGAMTNEPVMKYLSQKLSSQGERLDKIIAIVSEKIRTEPVECGGTQTTSYDYFSRIAVCETGSSDIMIPVAEKSEMGELINDICSHIDADDVIYIDTTGGFRKITNMLQLLTKILRYKGISNPVSYYANLQEKRIETTEEFITLTELADGVNEFASTGRSDQLSRCFGDAADSRLDALLSSMQRFTDNIRLCNVDNLEDDLNALKKALEAFESSESGVTDTRVVVLRQLIPVIREKFFGSSLSPEIDYCRMIGWCLDNGLVQQALTVFTEKIAIELFKREIISVDSAIYEEVSRNGSTMFSNPETELFYSNMMSSAGVITNESDKIIKAMDDHLSYVTGKLHNLIKPDNATQKALAEYMEFEKELKRGCERYPAGSVLRRLASSRSEGTKRIAKILIENKPDICYVGSFEKFANILKNDKRVIKQVLGLEGAAPDNDKNTYSKKFLTASEFEKSEKYNVSGFSHRKDISNRQFAEIMYGYLYVKTTRNRINHASDNGTLTAEQENALRKHGYVIGNELTYSDITENIRRALDTVTALK